jgi:hypothetical protein
MHPVGRGDGQPGPAGGAGTGDGPDALPNIDTACPQKSWQVLLFTLSDWKSSEENTMPGHRLGQYFVRTMLNLHDSHS